MLKPKIVAILPALVVLSACGGRVQTLTVDAPRQARAVEEVEMLLDLPDREYRTVALIRSPTGGILVNLEDLKQMVREAAAEYGADAVVLGFESSANPEGRVSAGNDRVVATLSSSDELRVFGRAIVYTDRTN